ncbi:MAG: winged helix-turn-helix transcriptional regulator [Candidatus Omnitrophica bacterium]|nr:winged helix-turn-helix transcriptional regulator [Candidatus Omnitrophota bacterium]
MEKKGLVCRESGKDRRERRVCLTTQGGRVLEKTRSAWLSAQEKVTQKIGKQKLERLMADLSAVVDCCK